MADGNKDLVRTDRNKVIRNLQQTTKPHRGHSDERMFEITRQEYRLKPLNESTH